MAGVTRRLAIVALLTAGSFACAGSDTTVDSAAPTAVASMVPMCAPYPYSPPMSVVDGVRPDFPPEPDPVLVSVLETYGRDHPEAWAGLWLTPTDGKDNVSVGIVGDVDAHRDAILERSAQPGDVQVVHPAPSTNTTTVGESSFTVEVMPATRTLAELEQLQRQIGDETTSGAMPLEFSALSVDHPTNVVRVGMPDPTDDARRLLAERYDASAICVEEMARFSPAHDTTGTTMGGPIRE